MDSSLSTSSLLASLSIADSSDGTKPLSLSITNLSSTSTDSKVNVTAGESNVKRDENLAAIEVATLGTLFILIVFGNCCVLLALALRRLKMTRMYYYLLHLCLSDLITGFFTVLPQLAWDITHRFNGGNILCKSIKCLQIFGPYLSSYVLVMTAIDRYQAICFPLTNCGWTPRRSKLMIGLAWFIAVVCSLPQAFLFSYQRVPNTDDVFDCWGTFPQPWGERVYVTWYAVSVFFVPLLVLVFTHIHICREIWVNVNLKRHVGKRETANAGPPIASRNNSRRKSADCKAGGYYSQSKKCLIIAINRTCVGRARRKSCKRKADGQQSPPDMAVSGDECGQQRRPLDTIVSCQDSISSSPRVNTVNRLSRAKIKTVKITVVVILCYIVCSSPFICVQLWAYWWPNAQTTAFWTGPVNTILMLLSSLNSSVNPFIYLFFNQNLVKSLAMYCCHTSVKNEELSKTNASELNSNYNEQRNPSQSSYDNNEENRKKNSNTFSLSHRMDYNHDNSVMTTSKARQTSHYSRSRRASLRRKNCHLNDKAGGSEILSF